MKALYSQITKHFGMKSWDNNRVVKQSDYDFEGFDLIVDRNSKVNKEQKSRFGAYVKRNINYRLRYDLMSDVIPDLWLEMGVIGGNILVGGMYREFQELNGDKNSGSEKEQLKRMKKYTNF